VIFEDRDKSKRKARVEWPGYAFVIEEYDKLED